MEELEQIVQSIKEFTKDLSATVNIGQSPVATTSDPNDPSHKLFFVPQYVPDNQKRANAREGLKKIQGECKYDSCKLLAAYGLVEDPELDFFGKYQLKQDTHVQEYIVIRKLKDRLSAMKEEHEVDSETRLSALKEVAILSTQVDMTRLMRKTYRRNYDPRIRELAGKLLGYSDSQIERHLSPISTSVKVIVAGAAALAGAGIVYEAYKYFSQ